LHGREARALPGRCAVVGEEYTPLQNREASAFFDGTVGKGGDLPRRRGDGPRERVRILARLPDRIRVVGDDITDKYLLPGNGRDGNSAAQVKFRRTRGARKRGFPKEIQTVAPLLRSPAQGADGFQPRATPWVWGFPGQQAL